MTGQPSSRSLAVLAVLAAAAIGVASCGGGGSSPAAVASVASVPTSAPTVAATPPPALVGTWVGVHNCQRIVDDLHAAGLDSQILPSIVGNGLLPGVTDPADVAEPDNPCVGAVDVKHSHFFTAEGAFGSLDGGGNQVDDGGWSIVDATTFAINGTPFHYQIEGNELRMEPGSVGSCPSDPNVFCQEAWKIMVAMPGMAWIRQE